MTDVARLPRIATIATLAGRLETFREVVAAIRPQVDHLFVYLDGYAEAPAFLHGLDAVTVQHAEALGDLHASARYLCVRELDEPAVIVSIDDDVVYPPDYVARMAQILQRIDGQALIGVHGRIFLPPHESYVRDAYCIDFLAANRQPVPMHELGAGTCCFVSDRLNFDPSAWGHTNMEDLYLSIEAEKRGLRRIAIARPKRWLDMFPGEQADSIWQRTQRDDTEQAKVMRELLALYALRDRAPVDA